MGHHEFLQRAFHPLHASLGLTRVGISSMEAANAPPFMADFNSRFAKVPRSSFNVHRTL